MKPPYPQKHAELLNRTHQLKAASLYGYHRTIEPLSDGTVSLNGQPITVFCLNDYLNLTTHPLVQQAAIEAVKQMGTGASTSPIIATSIRYQELEQKLAAFHQTDAAMLFSTGYQANVGIISTLLSPGDVIIADKLVHASIIDGCKLSGAKIRVFPHNDMTKLERILQQSDDYETRLIVTDSVFSMDGDLADLPTICALAADYGAFVMVDEAHAVGVLGEHGRGAVEHFGLQGRVDLVMGCLSKALASVGGYVCGSHDLIEILRHSARSYIFSTALPPSVVATAIAAIEVIQNEPHLREKLWANTAQFKAGLDKLGFNTMNSVTPILPILIGDDIKTLQMAKLLEDNGLFVSAIIHPGVPRNQARLRIRVSATHSSSDIEYALHIFAKVGDRLGII